jgi:hypothetical protein
MPDPRLGTIAPGGLRWIDADNFLLTRNTIGASCRPHRATAL